MITPSDAARRLPYIGALDGLRALAVLAVLFYHLDAPWSILHLKGGFFGVDVFFVLSGYLITSILLSEWKRSRGVSLPSFWRRRARRLLPAVGFLLGAVLLYALVFLPGEVASLRSDAIASVGYVTNWYLIFHDQSYFESWGRPSLFQHLWSLAIEEQFYLLWPLLFVAGMRVLKLPGLFVALIGAATVATISMALLYEPGADPSRIYYGTDTRSAGLLIGSALALVLPATSQAAVPSRTRDAIGLIGLGVLAYFFLRVGDGSALTFRGGFAIVALASAAVIATSVSSQSRLGEALGSAPLRWIGIRSYSIYLWHWPVFMLTRPGFDVSFGGWPLMAMQLALVAALAEVSYRYVETPIRTGGLLRAWQRWREQHGATALRKSGLALAGVSVAVVAAMTVALWRADAPAPLTSSSSIGMDIPSAAASNDDARMENEPEAEVRNAAPTATERSLASATPVADDDDTPTAKVTSHCSSVYSPGHRAESCSAPTAEATPPPTIEAAVVALPRVTAIGDSVMLGAAPQLMAAFDTTGVHAEVGLQVSAGNELLKELKAAGLLGDVVVVHLGTNGEFNGGQLAEMMEELKDTRLVVFVNLKVPRPWQDNNNHMLEYAVGRYPNARLIDWHAESKDKSQYFWDDGTHLRPEGALVYTGLILGQVREDWPKVAGTKAP